MKYPTVIYTLGGLITAPEQMGLITGWSFPNIQTGCLKVHLSGISWSGIQTLKY